MRLWPVFLIPALAACATVPPPAEVTCPAGRTVLPPEWTGWNTPRPLAAATSTGGLGAARFAPGQAIELALQSETDVAYVATQRADNAADSFGGLAEFTVERAGRYGVGVSAPAWIDVTRDGKPTATAAFGPGPACSPVRKVVAFDLVPGDYVLEIAGNETANLRVMVAAGGSPVPRE